MIRNLAPLAPLAPLALLAPLAALALIGMSSSAGPRPDPLIIPRPKSARFGGSDLTLRSGAVVSVSTPAGEARIAAAVRSLAGELGQRWVVRRSPAPGPFTRIRIGAPAAGDGAGEWARNPEGYRLAIGARGLLIEAPRPEGAFYALQTLAQIARRTGSGAAIRTAVIEDWPSLPFRGAHWFPSAAGGPFHRRLIRRIMARYKLNRAVIQCEAARWTSHPEIAAPTSISKAGLRALVRECRARFIDPVPLINGPGHAQWMFRGGRNLELAEDPQAAYAYCVRHPGSRRFMRDILREALEVFRPRWVHLGHDEVTLRGRFPRPDCPRCAGATVTDLLMENAADLQGWLRARGVGTMIWGDMLFDRREGPAAAHAPSPEEARLRRRKLPRGILVADWQYNTRGGFPSLGLLRADGIPAVACTWHEPANIHGFVREALRQHGPGHGGLLQTTWAGYFPDERVLRGPERRQFAAFILAAEYAWSGRSDPPAALGYDPDRIFTRSYTSGS